MPDDDGGDPGERLAAALRDAERLLTVVALLLATIAATDETTIPEWSTDDGNRG